MTHDDRAVTEPLVLDAAEIRVLGTLIEKHVTTPEYYPLTLNALVSACNQTTNREPITSYDETVVARAIERLRVRGLVWEVTNSRAHKFGTPLGEKLHLGRPAVAVMCVLMLRGPQTPGEIRGRTGRMHAFASIEEVDAVLDGLSRAEPPLVAKLPRQPGTKESRYAQLLGGSGGDSGPSLATAATVIGSRPAEDGQIDQLETQVEALRAELSELRQRLEDLTQRIG